MDGCKSIMCSVSSCIHNQKEGNVCNLDSIQVSASANSQSGAPYEETLCASYKPHQQMK